MQVIEKVKVVPEGYNGAGMNYDGCNRRDVNGKANAGLTLGIIGTALGAWALFGNRRSAGASILGGAGGGMLGDGSTNIPPPAPPKILAGVERRLPNKDNGFKCYRLCSSNYKY